MIDPSFAQELALLDDATDFAYDFMGWIEDLTGELDMKQDYEQLFKVCDELLGLFCWPEYTGSDLKFLRTTALSSLGRDKESVRYCRTLPEILDGICGLLPRRLTLAQACTKNAAERICKSDATYNPRIVRPASAYTVQTVSSEAIFEGLHRRTCSGNCQLYY